MALTYLRRLTTRQKLRYFYNFYRFRSIYKKDRRRMEAWQAERLRMLIPTLEHNIILFRRLLQNAGIAASDIVSIADLAKLPILSKETFRNHPISEFTISTLPSVGQWVTTSGTSGMPFTALRRIITTGLPLYLDFMIYRFLMEERPWRMDATWARIAFLRVLPLKRDNAMVVFADELFARPEKAIDDLIEFDPYVIEGHASFLEELARNVERVGRGPRPKYAVSGSERLSPASRAHIEQQLGCTVFNRYGLEETGTLAMDCSAHDGFHVYVESCIIEIVDTDGHPVPEGQSGKILVTDLYNYEMPFVRYDTGDRGYVSWEQCSCGLRSPRIWITGRYSAKLAFGPRIFHQFEFSELMQSFAPYIFRYLIVKRSDASLEARIIPTQSYGAHAEQQIRAQFEKLMGPSVSVAVTIVDSIPRLPRGKSKIVLDESGSN